MSGFAQSDEGAAGKIPLYAFVVYTLKEYWINPCSTNA
jgi:hypothetical protein